MALITGASSGIGEAVARALAEQGTRVALVARRRERLEALAEEIRRSGGEAMVQPADVTDRIALAKAAAAVREEWGGVRILVNNAGIMPLSPMAHLRVEDWERMVDVNVKGVLFGIAAVLPDMLAEGDGHIVNVGSLAGRRPFPGGAVYSATKFAVRSLTWGMQLELSAARGIRVTDVQPGVVDTELTDHIPDPELRDGFESGWADRRKLRPADVAAAVLFALTAPPHVNVNEILVRPTDQPT
ncbi:MAG TPA: SDR family oxidoreductase [Longimicrobiales bacterium]|nr:SDR family oxidoreductase [Longimicrobiales bacterium]